MKIIYREGAKDAKERRMTDLLKSIRKIPKILDSRLRGNDGRVEDRLRFSNVIIPGSRRSLPLRD